MIAVARLVAALLALCLCLPTASTPIRSLRICKLFDNAKHRLDPRFRDHAARIMRRHDFRIVAIWETRNEYRTGFACLLQWPDEATMRDRRSAS